MTRFISLILSLSVCFFPTLKCFSINPGNNASIPNSATITCSNSLSNFFSNSKRDLLSPDTIIINKYTPVISLDKCNNSITVENASDFNIGDTVLMIQMKGAVIDSTNTVAFGDITDYGSAGNYEYNYIKSKSGNTIELLNRIIRTYDVPNGKVQLVRVPYYINVSFSDILSASQWDGSKGGVLAMNVRDTLTLNAEVNISGKGFRGGQKVSHTFFICDISDYFVTNTNGSYGALKGESIVTSNRLYGRGKLASGGGGGNSHNSGGAGGANGGNGGTGGNQYDHITVCTPGLINGGIGGTSLTYTNAQNKIFLGGGGGAGHDNESLSVSGGNGGGIAIINARVIKPNQNKIISNGNSPISPNVGPAEDGKSGGGAGGTVLINSTSIMNVLDVETKGGNGDKVVGFGTVSYVGPGGGGGGGVVWINAPTYPAMINTNLNAGLNGTNIYLNNNPWGATPGASGQSLNNLVLPIATVPFKPNIDSVRFNSSATSCLNFNFSGLGYTNTNPIATWHWNFGDGNTANTQNASHTFATAGVFNVKLIVTDINGCKDSITKTISTGTINAFAGNDASFCSNNTVTHQLNGMGGSAGDTYTWTPAAFLNNPTIANPVASVNTTTTFYLTITSPTGCSGNDTVVVNVNPVPILNTFADTAICANSTLVLNASGATSYSWSPASSVSNPSIANPVFTGTTNQLMTVTGFIGNCTSSQSFNIALKTAPVVTTIPDSTICSTQSIVLTTTGAQFYSWTPSTNLSNPNIANPIFSGTTGMAYTVTGTAANGCSSTDNITITVATPINFNQPSDTSVCINNSVTLNSNNNSGYIYQWSPPTGLDNPTIANPVFTASSTGIKTLNLTITEPVCNKTENFQVTVLVNALPILSASSSNDINCSIGSSTLTASGASTYSWTPAGSLNNASIASPIASPQSTTVYTVSGTDINGCVNTTTVEVKVGHTEGKYYIPNSFTPNGDGLNDCFGVKHWGYVSDFKFIIYNRWGEKVFETSDINNCWDGRFKSQASPMGNYVYYIHSNNNCSEQVKKGNVLLIR